MFCKGDPCFSPCVAESKLKCFLQILIPNVHHIGIFHVMLCCSLIRSLDLDTSISVSTLVATIRSWLTRSILFCYFYIWSGTTWYTRIHIPMVCVWLLYEFIQFEPWLSWLTSSVFDDWTLSLGYDCLYKSYFFRIYYNCLSYL